MRMTWDAPSRERFFLTCSKRFRAFSSEVDAGSREENASK